VISCAMNGKNCCEKAPFFWVKNERVIRKGK
jgi:hypothetical protein